MIDGGLNLDHLTPCYNFTSMLLLCKSLRRTEMNITKFKIALLAFVFVLLSTSQSFSRPRFESVETDTGSEILMGFFDLRDRETFIQPAMKLFLPVMVNLGQ